MSEKLYALYHNEIPSFILPFLKSDAMNRIDHVGMHCSMEYTDFSPYKNLKKYSRYEHSLSVCLIIYHFTKDKKMALSGLFHDIATPCFAHVIDFLNNDHEKQESTEEMTASIIKNDKVIQEELSKLNIKNKEINDYHIYPIADNDSPQLSSDRLEYTLHNFYNFQLLSLDEIKEIYDDLIVIKNEENEDEIGFKNEDIAKKFTSYALKTGRLYITDEDRYGMEYLSHVLKDCLSRKILAVDDLYSTEENVIEKIMKDEISKNNFLSYRKLHVVEKVDDIHQPRCYKILAKKRYIDPLVKDKGRVSEIYKDIKKEIIDFKNLDFNYYLIGR